MKHENELYHIIRRIELTKEYLMSKIQTYLIFLYKIHKTFLFYFIISVILTFFLITKSVTLQF